MVWSIANNFDHIQITIARNSIIIYSSSFYNYGSVIRVILVCHILYFSTGDTVINWMNKTLKKHSKRKDTFTLFLTLVDFVSLLSVCLKRPNDYIDLFEDLLSKTVTLIYSQFHNSDLYLYEMLNDIFEDTIRKTMDDLPT